MADRCRVIYNSVGQEFERSSYNPHSAKVYDFVTLRSDLDGSKYCIDIVTDLARNYPQYGFCVVGRGSFFQHYPKPDNLALIERSLGHSEIVELLNQSRCALMPTRLDAQGVMACETATFGIPVITSDLPLCTSEIFRGFRNVGFISNESPIEGFVSLFEKLVSSQSSPQNARFYAENTTAKEVALIRDALQSLATP